MLFKLELPMFINMGALMKRSRNQSSQMIGFPYLFDQKHPFFFWREHHSGGSSSIIHGPFVDDLDDLHFQFPHVFIPRLHCNRHFGQESDSRYQEWPAAQQKLQRGQSRWSARAVFRNREKGVQLIHL